MHACDMRRTWHKDRPLTDLAKLYKKCAEKVSIRVSYMTLTAFFVLELSGQTTNTWQCGNIANTVRLCPNISKITSAFPSGFRPFPFSGPSGPCWYPFPAASCNCRICQSFSPFPSFSLTFPSSLCFRTRTLIMTPSTPSKRILQR